MKQRTRPWALIKVTHWAYAYTKASPSPGCKTKATLCQTSLLLRHTLLLHCTSYVFSCRVFAAPDIAAPTLYVIRCTSYVVRHAYSVAVHLLHQTSLLLRCTSYIVRHTLYVMRTQLPCICNTRHRCSYVVRHTLYVMRTQLPCICNTYGPGWPDDCANVIAWHTSTVMSPSHRQRAAAAATCAGCTRKAIDKCVQ